MRIAFTVHKFPPESVGGTEIYSWGLARSLAAAGHNVHVFYPLADLPPSEARIERDGVHLWRVPSSSGRATEGPIQQFWHTFRDIAIEAAFQQFLAEVQPEVVHFQHVQGVSAQLIELAAGRPRVVTLHDYWYFCANSQLVRPNHQTCGGPRGGWNCVDCATARADLNWLKALRPLVALPFSYRNAYLRRLTEQADRFLAPSDFLRQEYIRHGFPAERIVVIENGLDSDRLARTSDIDLPAPPARPHFGFLGSLVWQKGVHVLIEAFNQLPANAALTIYGNEDSFPEYARQVKTAAHHPHVRFGGLLPHQYVGAALRQMDCLVVPSLWYENSPLVIQEAYGLNVPVVASRLGALAEKVQDDITGRLFITGDSADLARVLRELIEQPQQLAALRANIRPTLTMRQHAQQIVEIYQALLANRDRGTNR
ncbi:MAG TPA: glycosyltransferase family 4 protein [Anaerolineae bacterium]|nr:glycosyltransferase family 4 protein [Anaerolineae bacterium]